MKVISMKKVISMVLACVMVMGTLVLAAPNVYAANPFSSGQCTWYAYQRWSDLLGYEPAVIPGNAGGWYANASAKGFSVGSTPAVGAIACWNDGFGTDAGHVAIVESIDADGINISEYNWAVSKGYSTAKVLFSNINRSSTSKPDRHLVGYIYLPGNPIPPIPPTPNDEIRFIDGSVTSNGFSVYWNFSNCSQVVVLIKSIALDREVGSLTLSNNYTYNFGVGDPSWGSEYEVQLIPDGDHSRTHYLRYGDKENRVVLPGTPDDPNGHDMSEGVRFINQGVTASGFSVYWNFPNCSQVVVLIKSIALNREIGSLTLGNKYDYNFAVQSIEWGNVFEVRLIPDGDHSRTHYLRFGDIENCVVLPAPTLTSISLESKPTKIVYEIGESLNTAGLRLNLHYDSGLSETITSGFTTSGFDSSTSGTKTVTVSYKGKTATFQVTVVPQPVTLTSISIDSLPTKTVYGIGESLNTSGLKLTLHYSDSTTETVTDGFTTSGFSSETVGTKTVTVSYGGYTTSFQITVEPQSVTLTSISIVSEPTILYYGKGESLDTTGLKLRLYYSNGSSKTITEGFTISGFSSETVGQKTVTVSYGGYTDSFIVTVADLWLILNYVSIASQPAKTVYGIGESLDTEGLKLKLCYVNGSSKTITDGFTTSGFDSTTAGTKTVTVTYGGHSTTFTVTVNAKADDPQIVIDSKTVHAGDTVQIGIVMKNAEALKSIGLIDFSFDSDVLELVSGEWKLSNSILKDVDVAQKLAAITFNDNANCNGEILVLTFAVKEDAEDGTYPVSCTVTAKQKVQAGEQDYYVAVISGNVQVSSVVKGDMDGDDVVTSDDAIYLLYHTLFPGRYPINQNADFDKNGVITSDDAIYLLYYTLFPARYPLN